MSTKDKLEHRLTLVELLKSACALLLFGPPIVFVLLLLMIPVSPEAGFQGIGLIFGWGMWSPVLLIPLVGFFVAKGRAAVLKRKISELSDENEKSETQDVA